MNKMNLDSNFFISKLNMDCLTARSDNAEIMMQLVMDGCICTHFQSFSFMQEN